MPPNAFNCEPQPLDVLGVPHVLYVAGDRTHGGLAFAEMRVPPGMGIPRHVHTREDEVFYVIEGQIVFTLDDREFTAGPGATVFGPRRVPHAYRAAGAGARALVTIAPAGMEEMLRELSRLPAGPPDPPRVSEIVARYGISFV